MRDVAASPRPRDGLQRPDASQTVASTRSTPYVIYYAINVKKVPNLKQRQAIAVALDRAQLRKIAGGDVRR